MIELSIAFDSKDISAFRADSKIYPVSADSDLRIHVEASFEKHVIDLILEVTVEMNCTSGIEFISEGMQDAAFGLHIPGTYSMGILQIFLEIFRTLILHITDIEVGRIEGGDDIDLLLSSGNSYIEPVLSDRKSVV